MSFANWQQGAFIIFLVVAGVAAFFYGMVSAIKKGGGSGKAGK